MSIADENGQVVPSLQRTQAEPFLLTDTRLFEKDGIRVAFSGRTGGVSKPPYESLNLGAHVGDDPGSVDENRSILLSATGLARFRHELVTCDQVHGDTVRVVARQDSGSGSHASGEGDPPLQATDAIVTLQPGIPLLMLAADCVPIVLVATGATPGVAVIHAGWRGALASLPGKAAQVLARETSQAPENLYAYIGPHIGECCYEVDEELSFLFGDRFDTIAAVAGHVDLAAAVRESLFVAGLRPNHVAEAGVCTRDQNREYFSYRACKRTGRQGALAVLTKGA